MASEAQLVPGVQGRDRHHRTLERLLAIPAADVGSSLQQATDLLVPALRADKIDAFLHDATRDTLCAVGTSDTPLGRLQKSLGLDTLAVANGGRSVAVWQSGEPWLDGQVDRDTEEIRGVREGLGVRSQIAAPLDLAGTRRGVLLVTSTRPGFFVEEDLRFVMAAARWLGLLLHRAELVEQIASAAAERGRRTAAEDLITVLAHDLRNYLTPLRGRLELVMRRAVRDGRDDDLRDATRAIAAAERLIRLVSDLLDVARLDQGLFSVRPAPIDLVALTQDVAVAQSTPSVKVKRDSPPELVISADPDRIRQAVSNLVANAVKHSPPGAEVTIAVSQSSTEPPRAILEVIDQGPGVAPEILPLLFDRYASGNGSSGLGLGLYLAHGIAVAHGGSLVVESQPGRGARFRMTLPAEGSAAPDELRLSP